MKMQHMIVRSFLVTLPLLAFVGVAAAQQAAPPAPDKDEQAQPPANKAPPAADQPGSPVAAATEPEIEEITITGSRILTNPLDAPAPILSLSRQDLDVSGLTSVADILQQLPSSGGALNTRFNSSGNFGFPPNGGGIGAGAAQVDLRYLGSQRVLVLVDGVRWVNGSSASGVASATDLNTIPMGIIERIEVLQDGASAVYGSDAIAGVVNIITKKDFEGVQTNAYLGGYGQGDGLVQQYDATFGTKKDRLSMMFTLSYETHGRVNAIDRAISRFPVSGLNQCAPSCSSGTPKGRFVFTDPNTGTGVDVTLNDGVSGTPIYDPADPGGAGDDYHAFATADRFNFASFNLVETPSARGGIFGQATYELADEITFFMKALYNNRRSTNQAAPEPIFIGPEAGNGNRLDQISVDATNPYNPFGFTLDAASNPYFIGRRPLEAGPRIFRQNVDTVYVSGGLRGTVALGDRGFFWDTTAIYSRNRADQVKNGAFNSAKLEKALGPLADCNSDPECVPFNIFGGPGTITQEMLDYVTFVQKDLSQQELFDASANVTGDLFRLPAGSVAMATGLEYRHQQGFFQPDAVVVAGDSAGVPSTPTSGEFDVFEAYAEIAVPIAKELPGLDRLDVTAAVRASRYSTFGWERTFKTGLLWRPIEDLLLRGTFAQGFRAPGIGELFGNEARFDQTLNDPCSDFLGLAGGTPAPQVIVDNCISLGIPADGGYEQINSQISVTTGGNRDLDPETSKGITASLVYSPTWLEDRTSWLDDLNLELVYYRIDLDKAIRAVDAQVQIDTCVRTLDPVLCSAISRTAGGTINGFDNQLTNIGGLETTGVDVKLAYTSPQFSFGRFRLVSLNTFLGRFNEKIPSANGFTTINRAGTEVGDPEQAYVKFKSTLSLSWARNDLSANWTTRYIHSVTEPCHDLQAFPGTCSDPNLIDDSLSTNKLKATVYMNTQLRWAPSSLDRRFDVTLGVNNLLNQAPPNCYSCALNGFDATTYNTPGVFAYVRAGYRM